MSTRNYTVTINVKDGGVLKRLEQLQSGSPIGGKGGGGMASSGGGIMNKLESLGMGSMLKLAGIATGVASLVALTIKSSGILQSTLRLWESGMMLILKPIGDFIGLMLRPFTYAVLKLFILPFYNTLLPLVAQYGPALGEFLVNPVPHLDEQKGKIDTGFVGTIAVAISALNLRSAEIGQSVTDFAGNLRTTFEGVKSTLFQTFTTLGTNLSAWFANVPQALSDIFFNLGNQIATAFVSIPGRVYDAFTAFIEALKNALSNIPKMIADTIAGGLGNSNIPRTGAGSPSGFFGGRWATRMQALGDTNPPT
jgi:hypothetical protein